MLQTFADRTMGGFKWFVPIFVSLSAMGAVNGDFLGNSRSVSTFIHLLLCPLETELQMSHVSLSFQLLSGRIASSQSESEFSFILPT